MISVTFVCGLLPVPLVTIFPIYLQHSRIFRPASNPSSVSHYGNLTSSRWVVKGTLERTFEKGAYALCISMLVRAKSCESSSHKCVDENPQQDDHSCLNWNITDNDSIIALLYMMWKIPWYMAVLSQNLISLFEKQPFPGGVCVAWVDWCLHTYQDTWLEKELWPVVTISCR